MVQLRANMDRSLFSRSSRCTLPIPSSQVVESRTPFIGRIKERERLIEALGQGSRLLTLTGPSGMGKTRLARKVAAEVSGLYEEKGGIWYCSLATCQTAADLEAGVARTLGIPQLHGESLARAIANRGPTLLVLDNVDSVARLCAEVLGRWLDGCPELQMLATSIVPIEVEGAFCLEVGPLEAEDAVSLYLERAHRASGSYELSREDEGAIEKLAGRLDRSPLAIELAAARVRVLPPRTLLARFEERFELLRDSSRGRHGSLTEALTLTWELLTERETLLLSKLSVFEGGFTYEGVLHLLSDGAGRKGEVLELLDGLRSKALLQVDDSEDPPRFHLFESIKDYGHRELLQSGQLEQTLARHATYFVQEGERHLGLIEGEQTLEALGWLKNERDNLLAALHRNLESDPTLSARAGLAIAPVLYHEGHGVTQARLLDSTLDAARRSGASKLVIKALSARSDARKQWGELAEALAASMEALALAREIGDRVEEGHLLIQVASLHVRAGEFEKALPALHLAHRIAIEEAAPMIEGMGLVVHGELARGKKSREEADRHFNRALEIFKDNGLVRRAGLASAFVGMIRLDQGRFRDARRSLLHALAEGRRMGNRTFEANTLGNLGCVEFDAGLLDEAKNFFIEALAIHREIGNSLGEGIATCNLGIIALEREELEKAERLLVGSESILVESGGKTMLGEVLPFIAVVAARRGRILEARQGFADAQSYLPPDDGSLRISRMDLVEGIIEVAEARAFIPSDPAKAESLIELARRRYSSALAQGAFGTALRLLERELSRWASEQRDSERSGASGLRVGPSANWFELLGSPRVRLSRRTAIRRVMDALIEERLKSPGAPLSPHDLFDVGWPNEQLPPDIALRRVYVGISELRKLGLSDVLLHQTEGYLIAPQIPVIREVE